MISTKQILKRITGLAGNECRYIYDDDADVLYTIITHVQFPYELILDGGIIVSVDPDSYLITGFTIIDYKKRLINNTLGQIPFYSSANLPSSPEVYA